MAKRLLAVAMCLIVMLGAVSANVLSASATESAAAGETPLIERTDADIAGTGVTLDSPIVAPRIVVTTENGNGTELQKEDGYVNASISITDADGTILSDSCQFKVRGNTTAMTFVQKKAYTFKFAKKKNVLGMGSGKKWALVANAFDSTLLRNYMAFEFARELGLPYTSEQRFAEVFVDGSYRGCYTVYEPVEEGKDRVNIDIESNNGMNDFLIEYEAQREEADTTYFTVNGLRFISSEPDEPNEEQLAYITGTMTDIINTLKTGSREEIEAVLDVDSFAKFYLLNEYLKTFDFDMSSVFFFYQNGKLYAGPAWDYDLCAGNLNENLTNSRVRSALPTDGLLQNKRNIYKFLCDKEWFMREVKRVYEEHYDYIVSITADDGLLDGWRDENWTLFTRNASVWTWSKWIYNYQMKPLPTYAENMTYLKDWLIQRNAWLSDYFDLFSYEYMCGDADGSGNIEIVDVTVIQRLLANADINTDELAATRGAVSGDELDIVDATLIQRYLVGMQDPYGISETKKIYLRER